MTNTKIISWFVVVFFAAVAVTAMRVFVFQDYPVISESEEAEEIDFLQVEVEAEPMEVLNESDSSDISEPVREEAAVWVPEQE